MICGAVWLLKFFGLPVGVACPLPPIRWVWRWHLGSWILESLTCYCRILLILYYPWGRAGERMFLASSRWLTDPKLYWRSSWGSWRLLLPGFLQLSDESLNPWVKDVKLDCRGCLLVFWEDWWRHETLIRLDEELLKNWLERKEKTYWLLSQSFQILCLLAPNLTCL